MPKSSTIPASRHPLARSRLSNDPWSLAGVDGRSSFARRIRDICVEIASDLGGADRLSEAQRQLIRRAATLSAQCEAAEAQAAGDGEMDLERYVMAVDRLARVLGRLGLQRRAKDLSLDDYIRQPDAAG